jgi:hypothetical protein
MIQRMAGPKGTSAPALAKEVDVARPTHPRRLRQRSLADRDHEPRRQPKARPPAGKPRAVRGATQSPDERLGELLRREGLHGAPLRERIDAAYAPASLSLPRRSRSKKTPQQKRVAQPGKEVAPKHKAVAGVTALLALIESVSEYWGGREDDGTGTERGS